MLAEGAGCFNVARTLNEQGIPSKTHGQWSARTIYNMAGNPAYAGMTYYGQTRGSRKTKLVKQPKSTWILLPDATPTIISKELFDRVQELREKNRELHKAKAKHNYLLRGHGVCGYCGSPLVGSFLNHSHRYYHCRGTYATATRQKIRSAKYIRADYLEDIVWENIKKILKKPEVVLNGITEQLQSEQSKPGTSIDKEIQKLKRRLKSYDTQEKRLIQLLRYEQVTQDSVLDEINQLKKEREADKKQLENYISTKERIANLENAELKLKDYCQRLYKNLDEATFEDKREILEMLAIKISATPEHIHIQGNIPLEATTEKSSDKPSSLLTIERTSA